ncbi:Hypothetical protein D9617_1g081180 [Elsinoe fawcettii]|nr:Hypothetical protein D9617_1g081180 [Elsinoe fawcettii]
MAKSRTQTPAPPLLPVDPSYPPLPPPSHFDILPPLHALLSRLEPSLNTYTPDPTLASSTPALGQSVSTSPQQPNGSSMPSQDATGAQGQALRYKDAAVAAGFLKSRIRKLLVDLAALEDMERTVDEQETEIGELEERVRGQREMLARLGEEAGKVLEDVERRG